MFQKEAKVGKKGQVVISKVIRTSLKMDSGF
jgi:bifunctional DNA-binding transcriptional regulator/antitoxin component of YhaV-PrlF toxin-antitoxin module